MNALIITTSARGSGELAASKARIWKDGRPLPLGHPLRYVLLREAGGVRLRDLGTRLDAVERGGSRLIPAEQLRRGLELELELGELRLRLREARELSPLTQCRSSGQTLRIYQHAGTRGAWVTGSFGLDRHQRFVAHRPGDSRTELFRLSQAGAQYQLVVRAAELWLLLGGAAARRLAAGESIPLTRLELEPGARLELRDPAGEARAAWSWSFSFADTPAFEEQPGDRDPAARQEQESFRRALRAAALSLGALLALAWLWPTPRADQRELIPAQFAKIVLSQPTRLKGPAPSPAESAAASNAAAAGAPRRAQDAAVARAFRSRPLVAAMKGLLARSSLATSVAGESPRVFDASGARSTELHPGPALSGAALAPGQLQVAAVGGGAGKGGSRPGYATGEHAGVKNQGRSFVPFVSAETNGSVVDEGLTRDEVGEVIHRHLSEVRYCYESAMIRTPELEGKLLTAFVINGTGAVKSAEAKSSSLPDPRLDDCILRRLVTWKFPKPRRGVDVAVTYPFIFKTLGR